MALDFQSLQQQITALGETAPQREQRLRSLRQRAEALLESHAMALEPLRAKVQLASQLVPTLRCARPEGEPLTAHQPPSDPPHDALAIAADGSQIAPDRHEAIDFYLINVGLIQMEIGAAQAPETRVRSQLFYGDDLNTPSGFISEGLVTLKRDLAERQALADHLPLPGQLVITMTDGPLELWGAKQGDGVGGSNFQESLNRYLQSLQTLHDYGAVTAGYVDKPRADLLVRLLEVASLEEDNLGQTGRERSLRGVTDTDLLHNRLAPGERSAVFGLQSQSVEDYTGELALHFFYLNVGRPGRPWLARVEVPRWVTADPARLTALHAVLVDQCQALGTRPYPYLLHRAHETAVVTQAEREQLIQMIALELRRRGVPVGEISAKQAAKGLAGRTRY